MSLLLKVMSGEDAPDEDTRKQFSIYTDIVSCHFKRHPDGSSEAHVWCREPVKTALVPGFVEIEKHIMLTGNAYLMNENGKTVSAFGVAQIPGPALRIHGTPDAESFRSAAEGSRRTLKCSAFPNRGRDK